VALTEKEEPQDDNGTPFDTSAVAEAASQAARWDGNAWKQARKELANGSALLLDRRHRAEIAFIGFVVFQSVRTGCV
jgi:hypothetical protein